MPKIGKPTDKGPTDGIGVDLSYAEQKKDIAGPGTFLDDNGNIRNKDGKVIGAGIAISLEKADLFKESEMTVENLRDLHDMHRAIVDLQEKLTEQIMNNGPYFKDPIEQYKFITNMVATAFKGMMEHAKSTDCDCEDCQGMKDMSDKYNKCKCEAEGEDESAE